MNKMFRKYVYFILLQSASALCDPSQEDCSLNLEVDYSLAPRRWVGAYHFQGVMSWIQALWMFAIMSSYIDQLKTLSPILEVFAWSAAGLRFAIYTPAAIFWMISAIDKTKVLSHLRYLKALRTINTLGWIMWLVDLGVWLVMLFMIYLDGLLTVAAGEEMPSGAIPITGLIVDLILQIIYSVTYGYSWRLLQCWVRDYPETGTCEPDMLNDEATSLVSIL